jgi:hypothetical protein
MNRDESPFSTTAELYIARALNPELFERDELHDEIAESLFTTPEDRQRFRDAIDNNQGESSNE